VIAQEMIPIDGQNGEAALRLGFLRMFVKSACSRRLVWIGLLGQETVVRKELDIPPSQTYAKSA